MSRKSGKGSSSPKLDLKLNLSPPNSTEEYNYNYNNNYSCNYNDNYNCNYNNYNNNYNNNNNYANYNYNNSNYNYNNGSRVRSPTESSFSSSSSSCLSSENEHEATSMVLAGCPRCFMYVLLSEDDPSCPKCKSPVLIDLLGRNSTSSGGKKKNRRS